MIGFRLDANEWVATGHMMRCIAIARKIQSLGEQCIFLLADDNNTDILIKNKMKYVVLGINWQDWDYGIQIVKQCISDYDIRLLVVDSYIVTNNFLTEINACIPVLYIDDMCKQAYDVTIVLHYSQWPEESTLQRLYKGKKTVLLYGMKYMPLRDEFRIHNEKIERKKQIMITMGGTDPYHITLSVVKQILNETLLDEYSIVAVLGKMNHDKEKLDELAKANTQLIVLQNISNMGEVMRQSCLAVCAGGASVYELCACQTPTVCVAFAEDHVSFAKKMEKHQILDYAGDVQEDPVGVQKYIIDLLVDLADDEAKQKIYRKHMQELVDGNGAERIAKEILKAVEK